MKWKTEPGGMLYRGELESPDGLIQLRCSSGLGIAADKWVWTVEWPGGQVARGTAPTLAVCKEMSERAGVSFEPFGDGFRKKDGYD